MVAQLAYPEPVFVQPVLSPPPPAQRISLGLPDRSTYRLFNAIANQCWLDHALQFGDFLLEHRTPEDFGRNFYALTWQGWLLGVQHYQNRASSIERVQWGLAILLRAHGWEPDAVRQVYCDDPWPWAAHRIPRLLNERLIQVDIKTLYRLASMHQRALRHEQLKPMTKTRWVGISGERGAMAWDAAHVTRYIPLEPSGWVNRERWLKWQAMREKA